MRPSIVLRPVTRAAARTAVARWHSHHRPHVADLLRIGAYSDGQLVAVVVVGTRTAPEVDDGETLEVTRLAVGPDAPHCTASRLLGAPWRTMAGMGVTRGVSYTRVDEEGTCYRAAGWVPTEIVRGRPHNTGNRALRWLPGLYEPSAEVCDRVRWEIGPRAATTRVRRNADGNWRLAA